MQGMLSVLVVGLVAAAVMFLLSFDSLEYQEMGLKYSFVYEHVDTEPVGSGRYFLGIGNRFLKFPKMVKSIYLIGGQTNYYTRRRRGSQSDQPSLTSQFEGPALQSRTLDGLNVRLEISFQYRLKFEHLYNLYSTLGLNYEDTLVRMAIEQLTTSTTKHPAHFFFTNRTTVGREMHRELREHFDKHAFSDVPFFQLRTVHLPKDFEDAIKTTQVKQQEIQIATLEQSRNTVAFETRVLQAEQQVYVLQHQAEAEVQSIQVKNDAYCRQFKLTQGLQATALKELTGASSWNSEQLLSYLRIRAVREHPSDKTTIRI